MTMLEQIEAELNDTNKAFRSHCVLRTEEVAALLRYVRAAEAYHRAYFGTKESQWIDVKETTKAWEELQQARKGLGLE